MLRLLGGRRDNWVGEISSEFDYGEGKGYSCIERSFELMSWRDLFYVWELYIEQLFAAVQGIQNGICGGKFEELGGLESWLWRTLSARLRYMDFPIAPGRHWSLLNVCVGGRGMGWHNLSNSVLGDGSSYIFRNLRDGSRKKWIQKDVTSKFEIKSNLNW